MIRGHSEMHAKNTCKHLSIEITANQEPKIRVICQTHGDAKLLIKNGHSLIKYEIRKANHFHRRRIYNSQKSIM